MDCRSLLHELKRQLCIVDYDNGLTHRCHGADWTIQLFVLEPVISFEDAWLWQVIYIPQKRETSGTWRQGGLIMFEMVPDLVSPENNKSDDEAEDNG